MAQGLLIQEVPLTIDFLYFFLSGISLLFFIMVWIVSAFFPLYLLYWSLNQAHVIYCHGNNKHNIFLEPPPLLQFYRKLKEAVRDLLMLPTYLVQVTPSLVASITTLRISSVATSCVSVSTTTYRRIADMVYCLDWRSRVCLAYLGSIVIINIRDIFKGPLKIPRFVKTLDDANISNFEKLRLRMMRCTLDWFLPGKLFSVVSRYRVWKGLLTFIRSGLTSYYTYFSFVSSRVCSRFRRLPSICVLRTLQ